MLLCITKYPHDRILHHIFNVPVGMKIFHPEDLVTDIFVAAMI